jgi:hypothetical protein
MISLALLALVAVAANLVPVRPGVGAGANRGAWLTAGVLFAIAANTL